MVQTDSFWNPLESLDKESWNFRNIELDMKPGKKVLSVQVHSPSLPIKCFKISWKIPFSPNSFFLGDHWERSYGDLEFKPIGKTGKMPWYFIAREDKETLCFGVKTGGPTICHWELEKEMLSLFIDTKSGGNGVQLGSRLLPAADILITRSNPDETVYGTARRFCKALCDAPRKIKEPVYGINDWYFAYGNNSADLILAHTALLSPLVTSTNKPFSVIDAGWASKSPILSDDCCWGEDFSISNSKFGDMGNLANQIKSLGMRPGLWLRPLCARHNDPQNRLLPSIPGRNNPKNPILDPSIDENLERIRNYMKTYKEWGYELVKHDYTSYDVFGRWGFEMKEDITAPDWHFNDTSKTNAEILLTLYNTIREACEDIYIIGCNTPGHLSAGLFELNRIGDDTSGNDWERTLKMGVNTLGFRMIQHRNFYEADADCVGITNKVPWDKNKQWMQLLARSSAPLFISAQAEAIGKEQKDLIKKSFTQAAQVQSIAEPQDWLDNRLPAKWKLDGEIVNFHWTS